MINKDAVRLLEDEENPICDSQVRSIPATGNGLDDSAAGRDADRRYRSRRARLAQFRRSELRRLPRHATREEHLGQFCDKTIRALFSEKNIIT